MYVLDKYNDDEKVQIINRLQRYLVKTFTVINKDVLVKIRKLCFATDKDVNLKVSDFRNSLLNLNSALLSYGRRYALIDMVKYYIDIILPEYLQKDKGIFLLKKNYTYNGSDYIKVWTERFQQYLKDRGKIS